MGFLLHSVKAAGPEGGLSFLALFLGPRMPLRWPQEETADREPLTCKSQGHRPRPEAPEGAGRGKSTVRTRCGAGGKEQGRVQGSREVWATQPNTFPCCTPSPSRGPPWSCPLTIFSTGDRA